VFEPKRACSANLVNYIGARVTDAEEQWLLAQMRRRKLTMSDLIRLAFSTLRSRSGTKNPEELQALDSQ